MRAQENWWMPTIRRNTHCELYPDASLKRKQMKFDCEPIGRIEAWNEVKKKNTRKCYWSIGRLKCTSLHTRTAAHRSFCSYFDIPIILFRPVSLGFMAIYRCLCSDYMPLMFIRPRKIYHIIRQAKQKKREVKGKYSKEHEK